MPSSLIGVFGLARQSAKDVVAPSINYLPATTVGMDTQQNSTTLPPEIGGDYFLRGSYKTSFVGSGDIGMVIRPNSFGNMLMAYSGVDTVTPTYNGQVGVTQHVFTPFAPAAGVDLPWFTAIKDVAKLYAVQFLNSKIRSLRIDIPKSSTPTASASFLATTPSYIASISSPALDTSPQFQTSNAVIALTPEGSGTNISANSIKMERFTLNMANTISEDEFSVGSFFLDGITLLQRAISVDMDIIVRDTALYQAVYLNGGGIPGACSPTLYRGSLTITLNSTSIIAGSQTYQMIINFPGLDFLMMPISLSGSDLVRATLSTQVTLGPSGSDKYTITLVNGVASY